VLLDRLGERVRALEHHADAAADRDRVDAGAVDRIAVQLDLAHDAAPGNELVHPVERPQERRLATTGRSDQGGDVLADDVQTDGAAPLLVAVEDRQVAHDELGGRRRFGIRGHAGTPARRRMRARTTIAAMFSVNVSSSSTSTVA